MCYKSEVGEHKLFSVKAKETGWRRNERFLLILLKNGYKLNWVRYLTDKYGLDCGLELNAKVFQLRLKNVSGVLVLEEHDYSSHIISRQSSRSLQWLLVSNSRADKGINGG